MSKQTATASTIQITSTTPVLMLALELGEESWKLGFSSAFGQRWRTGYLKPWLAVLHLCPPAVQQGAAADVTQRVSIGAGSFWHQPWVPQRPSAACATQLSARSVRAYGSWARAGRRPLL